MEQWAGCQVWVPFRGHCSGNIDRELKENPSDTHSWTVLTGHDQILILFLFFFKKAALVAGALTHIEGI